MRLVLFLLLFFCISVNATPLRVLQFNIWEGAIHSGIDPIIAIIRQSNADIINVSEAAYSVNNFNKIKDSLGFYGIVNAAGYHSGILSRYPLVTPPTQVIVNTAVSIYATLSQIAIGTDTIFVLGTHLNPLDDAAAMAKRRQEADYFCQWIRNKSDWPVIWLGDFNSIDATEGYTTVGSNKVEYLIPAIKDSLYALRFNDAYRTTHPSYADSGYTFIPTSRRLDYIFYNKFFTVESTCVLDASFYTPWPSDHYAVFTKATILNYKTKFPIIIQCNADNYVNSFYPTTNNGTNVGLVSKEDNYVSYLKFLLTTIDTTKTIDSLCLRIKSTTDANSMSSHSGDLFFMSDNSWTEAGQTYDNAQKEFTDTLVLGRDSIGWAMIKSYNIPYSSFIANDTLSLAIKTDITDTVRYASRQYTSEPPKLFVYYSSAPVIDSVRPVAVRAGEIFNVYGSNFGTGGSLKLNSIEIPYPATRNDSIVIDTIPLATPRGTYTNFVITNSDSLRDTTSIRVINPKIKPR